MDTTDTIDPTEVIDATSELDAPGALDLFPYPALGLALGVSAYAWIRQLLTWEVASTFDFAEKMIKYQRNLAEKMT